MLPEKSDSFFMMSASEQMIYLFLIQGEVEHLRAVECMLDDRIRFWFIKKENRICDELRFFGDTWLLCREKKEEIRKLLSNQDFQKYAAISHNCFFFSFFFFVC